MCPSYGIGTSDCPAFMNAKGPEAVKARALANTDPDVLEEYGNGEWPLKWASKAENGNFLEPNEIAKRHGVCGDPNEVSFGSGVVLLLEQPRPLTSSRRLCATLPLQLTACISLKDMCDSRSLICWLRHRLRRRVDNWYGTATDNWSVLKTGQQAQVLEITMGMHIYHYVSAHI